MMAGKYICIKYDPDLDAVFVRVILSNGFAFWSWDGAE